jgi:hypothetical protein
MPSGDRTLTSSMQVIAPLPISAAKVRSHPPLMPNAIAPSPHAKRAQTLIFQENAIGILLAGRE